MKHIILPSLIILVACTETHITDHTVEVISSEGRTPSEPPYPEIEGLSFGGIPSNEERDGEAHTEEIKWDTGIADLVSGYSRREVMARNHVNRIEKGKSKDNWRDANDFLQDDGSDYYQVFQSLQTQLDTEQLRIRCTGPTGTKLRYEAECQGKLYEVEYDLKSVQIIKVNNINQ